MTRILIADDSKMIRMMLRDIIEEVAAFAEIAEAADGAEALELLGEDAFDLVITDLYMPNVTGLQVIREMRESHPQTPVGVISSETARDQIDELKESGAAFVIHKPFQVDDVAEVLSAYADDRPSDSPSDPLAD